MRLIVEEAATESTSDIATRLKRMMAYSAYFNQYRLYLSTVVGMKKIRPPLKRQRVLDKMLTKPSSDAQLNWLVKERNKKSSLLLL